MKTMDKRWLSLIIFLPALLALFAANYYIDPANYFHDISKDVATAIVEGKKAGISSGNLDERAVKYRLIQNLPDHVETIAVGPSLVMCVGEELAGTESFYNLGVSGADFYDILNQFGALEKYEIKYDRVIFCVDTYFFDEALYQTLTRNEALKPYAEYMIKKLEQQEVVPPEVSLKVSIKDQIKQLLSLSYFQAGVSLVQNNGLRNIFQPRWRTVDESYTDDYYCADGSWNYDAEYQQNGVEKVLSESKNYDIDFLFSANCHISDYSKYIFEKLIQYWQSKGVEVELMMVPLAPALWDRISGNINRYPVISETEEFAINISEKYNLRLIGSENPYNMGISNEEFYDARHIKREMLGKYYDFSK